MYSIKILKYTEYRYSSITFGWYMLCGNDVIMHVIMLLFLAWENTLDIYYNVLFCLP